MASLSSLNCFKTIRFSSLLITNSLGRSSYCSKQEVSENLKIPEPPTTCCNSGCDNCVWIEYSELLLKMYKDGGERARKIIMEKVTDPNMKAFLLAELKALEEDK